MQFKEEITIYIDEKDEKLKTKKIFESEERFKLALLGSDVGIWDWNLEANKIYFSHRLEDILGFSNSEIENNYKTWYSLIHTDDIDKINNNLERHLNKNSEYFEVKFRMKTKKDDYRWILFRGRAIFDDKKTIRMVGLYIDIDEDIKQEIELNRIKKSFEEAQHIGHIGNLELNLTTSKLWWSDEIYSIFEEEVKSFEPTFEKFLSYIHEYDLENVKSVIKKTLENNSKYSITYRIVLKNKKVKYVKNQGEVVFEENGKASYLIGILQDITDLKKTQLELEMNQKHLRVILDTQRNIVIVNNGVYLLDANKAFFDFFSEYKSVEDFLKYHNCVYEFFAESNEDGFISASIGKDWLESIKKEKGKKDKVLIKRGDKNFIFLVHSNSIEFYGEHRNVIVFNDITEVENYRKHLEDIVKTEIEKRREQENILVQQSKMASMGEMIGAIAHQWRQPLNNLGLILFNIYDGISENNISKEEVDKHYGSARKLINQMSAYIDDFRNFFKPSKKKESFHLQKAIKDALSILSAQLKNNSISINIYSNYKEKIYIFGYENEFKHVILNLITNAKDVVLDRGLIEADIDIFINKKDNLIVISIEDSAGGVDDKIINRVFEPYFTTKENNKGTGIGLYMSKMIIENNMGGKIYVKNSTKGAKFTIEINEDSEN